jgi:hypothetical protein
VLEVWRRQGLLFSKVKFMAESFWQFSHKPLDDFRLQKQFQFDRFSIVFGAGVDPVGIGATGADAKVLRGLRKAGESTARNLAVGRRVGLGVFGIAVEVSADGFGSAELGLTASQQRGGKFQPVPSLTIKGTDGRARLTTDLLNLFYEVRQSVVEAQEAQINGDLARIAGDVAVFDSRIRMNARKRESSQSVYAATFNNLPAFIDKKDGSISRNLTPDQQTRFNDGQGGAIINNCLKSGGGQACYSRDYLAPIASGRNYGSSAIAECLKYGGGQACYGRR